MQVAQCEKSKSLVCLLKLAQTHDGKLLRICKFNKSICVCSRFSALQNEALNCDGTYTSSQLVNCQHKTPGKRFCMSKKYSSRNLSATVKVACLVLLSSSLQSAFFAYPNVAFAETATLTKAAKIEKLYEVSGAKERLDAALQLGAIKQAQSLQSELKKKLLQSKFPQTEAELISQSKADLFMTKMKTKIAPLVKESVATYSSYTDSNVTEPDVDFLLQYYSSPSVKAFHDKAKQLGDTISKPLLDEIQTYLKDNKAEVAAGRPAKPFAAPDLSKEIGAIDSEKLTTIKSILHSSSIIDNLAEFFKTTFDALMEGAPSDEEKKQLQTLLSGVPYKSILRPLVVIAYDKNFSEEELNGIDVLLSDSRMEAAKPHMTKAENEIITAIVPKYEKVAEATSKEVLADLAEKPSSPAGKASGGKTAGGTGKSPAAKKK